MSSSIRGRLPLEVVFHLRWSSIRGRLLLKNCLDLVWSYKLKFNKFNMIRPVVAEIFLLDYFKVVFHWELSKFETLIPLH